MARRICQTLFGLAVAYALAVGLFALIHYKGVERPDVVSVAGDFHGWIGGFFRRSEPPAPPPGSIPPRVAPPATPIASTPAPVPAPAAVEDPRTSALVRVSTVLLPDAEKKMADLGSYGPGFDERRSDLLAVLVQVRDILNPMLERDPGDREANDLWTRYVAIKTAAGKR
jgi:hypothetical protein